MCPAGGKRARKGNESPPPPEAGQQQQEEERPAAEELLLQAGGGAPAAAPCPLLAGVHFHSLDSHDEFVLWRLQPCYVVLYDPDMGFVRWAGRWPEGPCRG